MLIHRSHGVDLQLTYAENRRDARRAASRCRQRYEALRRKGNRKTQEERAECEALLDALDAAAARWGRSYR